MREVVFTMLAGAVCMLLTMPALAQQASKDLAQMSLEDLMNIEVTSVAKKEQKISKTAAAVFVITPEDIQASGANRIPDLLRMVPGLQVGQINASTWAISGRGLNGGFSNKLLVMLDGRSVYLPTFGGVFWDVLDVPLSDIERIEVIRGPGGTTWGANAVNGVINIITKRASDTRGGSLVAGAGNLDQGFGTLQYGGKLGRATDYRVFSKYANQYQLPALSGGDARDGWHLLRGGFRADSQLSGKDSLTLEGDLYGGGEGMFVYSVAPAAVPSRQPVFQNVELSGGYIQADWTHRYSVRSDSTLQLSYDRYYRGDDLHERRGTLNLDFEHHFAWNRRNDVVWGLGYRRSASESHGNETVWLSPPTHQTQLFSSFVQDEISLIADRLALTLGTKLEHNGYTGFGLLPSARVAWNIDRRRMIWAAISRAIRTPADVDESLNVNVDAFVTPDGLPALLRTAGSRTFQDEHLLAYELGYRSEVSERLSLDVATYYNCYDDLLTSEPAPSFFEPSPLPPHLVVPLLNSNRMSGETHGIEASAHWRLADRWSLVPAYAFEQIHFHLDPNSHDLMSVGRAEGRTPRNWARLESRLFLPYRLFWDVSATFSDRLVGPGVPGYVRVDTQVTRPLTESVTLTATGQNLLRSQHLEFVDDTSGKPSSLSGRSVFVTLAWRFR